jgi:hypothetical protein
MAGKDEYNKRTKVPGYQYPSSSGHGNPVINQENFRKKFVNTTRVKFDDVAKTRFLELIAEHGRKGDACLKVGICMKTMHDHIKNDPDFAEAMVYALEAYRDRVVAHVQDLALNGTLVKKYDAKGNCIEERQEYPIPLIMMEAKRVEKDYREKQQEVNVNFDADKTGVLVVPGQMTQEEWKERFKMRDITPIGSENA